MIMKTVETFCQNRYVCVYKHFKIYELVLTKTNLNNAAHTK